MLHIDYFQGSLDHQAGLKNRFGVRVWNNGCSALIQMGEDQRDTFGNTYPLPLELEALPAYFHMIINSHLLNYPNSDLIDLLTGRMSFHQAVNSSIEIDERQVIGKRALTA